MTSPTNPFAINTYSYTLSHAGKDCILHLAGQGYTDFELMMYPGHFWPADLDAGARRALRELMTTRGLRLVTLNMPNIDLNVAAASKEMRDYTLALLEAVIDLAGDLGALGVVVGPGKHNPLFPAPKDRLMAHFFHALDVLLPRAERAGTEIWLENMPFAFLPDADSPMAALDDYGEDRVGVVYDVANAVFIKEDIGAGLRRVSKRLRLMHLSDTGHTVYRHDPVGKGIVPFAEILPLLAEVGYTELPMLEIISHNADADIQASAHKLLALGWGESTRGH